MKTTKKSKRVSGKTAPRCSASVRSQLEVIKALGCFRCDGSKRICNICGESGRACDCEEEDFSECPDCCGPNTPEHRTGAEKGTGHE